MVSMMPLEGNSINERCHLDHSECTEQDDHNAFEHHSGKLSER